MTRPFQILFPGILFLAIFAMSPLPALADDMVVFKNGRTLRADELELKDGVYRITTMAGGVMEVPVALVGQVVPCMVDKDVEEQRGIDPPGPPPRNTAGGRSSASKIPPAGAKGGKATQGARGKGVLGGSKGGKGGGAKIIPPMGGKRPGKSPAPGGKSDLIKGGK